MSHLDNLTESQVRHVDYKRLDPAITWVDLTSESEARHVDEYRHAKEHQAESF